MKKFLSATLLVALSTAALSANMMMKPEEMVQAMDAVKGKTIEQPKHLMRSWVQYKAKAFKMASEAMNDFADQIKDRRERRKYERVADAYSDLAKKLEELPIPEQKLTKTFKHVDRWMKLKAEKAHLMAQEMRSIGKQLNNKKMLEKADEVEQWAKTLMSSVKFEKSDEEKEGSDDEIEGCDACGMTDDEVEGSDYGSTSDDEVEGADEDVNSDENSDDDVDVTNDADLEGVEAPSQEAESKPTEGMPTPGDEKEAIR